MRQSVSRIYEFHEDDKLLLFLLRLAPEDIACLRMVTLLCDEISFPFEHLGFSAHIDLDKETVALNTNHFMIYKHANWPVLLKQRLLNFVKSLPTSHGKKRLALQDIYKLRGEVEKVFPI